MENQKIIDKLNEIKSSLEILKTQHHSKGEETFNNNRAFLERIIDRIYPEKNATELKNKLMHKSWIITGKETDQYWQEFYSIKINLAIRIIDTILEENSLFGFDDFKPIKEKTESEVGLNRGKLSFFKRRTKEK